MWIYRTYLKEIGLMDTIVTVFQNYFHRRTDKQTDRSDIASDKKYIARCSEPSNKVWR